MKSISTHEDEAAVKQVVEEYLRDELEAMRGKAPNDTIFIGDQMKHYQRVKCKLYTLWHQKLNMLLTNYELGVKMVSYSAGYGNCRRWHTIYSTF